MLRRENGAVIAVLATLLSGCSASVGLAGAVETAPPRTFGLALTEVPAPLEVAVPQTWDDTWAAADVSMVSSVEGAPVSVTVRLLPADHDVAGTVTICTEALDAAQIIVAATEIDEATYDDACGDRTGAVERLVDGHRVVVSETGPASGVDWLDVKMTTRWLALDWVQRVPVKPAG